MSSYQVRTLPLEGKPVFVPCETLEEAKALAAQHAVTGGQVVDSLGRFVWAPDGQVAAELRFYGKCVADYVRAQQFVYGHAPINPVIDHRARTISCDRFVDWVLYLAGYVDQRVQFGPCCSSPELTRWCIDHGFTKIETIEELEPGDIIFTRPSPAGDPLHTFLHAGKAGDGLYYRYDCGSRNRIRCTNDEGFGPDYSAYTDGQPFAEPLTDFMYGYRVPRIKKQLAPTLSFNYDGVPFSQLDCIATAVGNDITYTLPDGLQLTVKYEYYPKYDVVKWTNHWHNPTAHRSGLITDLRDCDVRFAMPADPVRDRRHRQSTWEHRTLRLCTTQGANVKDDDHRIISERMWTGDRKEAACIAGRSGMGTAPFFEAVSGDDSEGVLLAAGWTGQWHAWFEREVDSFRMAHGIEDVCLRLEPGESFRTASTTTLAYTDGRVNAHNRWRRYIAEVISPFAEGKNCAGQLPPFSAIFWGGVASDELKRRWEGIFAQKLPFNYCWVDAGWYEPLCGATTAEQSAEWPNIGSWQVSRHFHPGGYRDVTDWLRGHGVKFLLWFEPERTRRSIADWAEYLWLESPDEDNVLLALHKDEVCDAVIEKVCGLIESIGVDCYRQDSNIMQLPYWQANDARLPNAAERRGATEIHYINNLWRFWDAMLARFPHLMIDNCAGGGHRIDIEMLARSVSIWRSDYQCTWDCCPEANQNQNMSAAWWYPYSGIGYGPTLGDTYSFRSAYTTAMTVRTWEHVDPEWAVGALDEPFDWARKYFAEYNAVRRYFGKDFYPLIPANEENTTWVASQYHDPADGTGLVLAFRRACCPYAQAEVSFGGLEAGKTYTLTNADTGENFAATGADLMAGITLTIPEKRQSLLLTYKG